MSGLRVVLNLPALLLVALIRAYQRLVSPVVQAVSGPRCRFHPSCSEYAVEAVRTRGLVIGTGLAAWRVARCQPFAKGGLDPVPPRSCRSIASSLKPAGATRAQ